MKATAMVGPGIPEGSQKIEGNSTDIVLLQGTTNEQIAKLLESEFGMRGIKPFQNLILELSLDDREITQVDSREIDSILHQGDSGLFFVRQLSGGGGKTTENYIVGTMMNHKQKETEVQLA